MMMTSRRNAHLAIMWLVWALVAVCLYIGTFMAVDKLLG